MRLINNKTGQEIKVGEVVHTHLGKAAIVTGWQHPEHEGSTGRVFVRTMQDNAFEMSYYPSVINAQWSNT